MNGSLNNHGDWRLVGHFGVDAGLVWIGDPCYILHKTDKEKPKEIGKNWHDFCNKVNGSATSFNYDMGHEGLGVCMQTGYGDGTYPVYARFEGNDPMQIFIDFSGEEFNEEEED